MGRETHIASPMQAAARLLAWVVSSMEALVQVTAEAGLLQVMDRSQAAVVSPFFTIRRFRWH